VIETLNAVQPFAIIFLMALFFTLEMFIPHLTPYINRKKHALRNLVIVFFCFLANGLAGAWIGYWISVIQNHGWGILNAVDLDPRVAVIAGVLLIDFDGYAYHVVLHKVSLLWRVHRVHHSDIELDSTSALRVHPLETMIQSVWRTVSFALLGVSFPSVVLFYTVVIPLLFVQHANIRFPWWMEKYAGALFVLSGWHRIHHSDERQHTDSHYGSVLTLWDRAFGTAGPESTIDTLSWGLKGLKTDSDQTVRSQLLLPFRGVAAGRSPEDGQEG